MKYYKKLGEYSMIMDYDEETELRKIAEEILRRGRCISVQEYVEFMHKDTDDDLIMEVMLILIKLLTDYPDIIIVDYLGYICISSKYTNKIRKEIKEKKKALRKKQIEKLVSKIRSWIKKK